MQPDLGGRREDPPLWRPAAAQCPAETPTDSTRSTCNRLAGAGAAEASAAPGRGRLGLAWHCWDQAAAQWLVPVQVQELVLGASTWARFSLAWTEKGTSVAFPLGAARLELGKGQKTGPANKQITLKG